VLALSRRSFIFYMQWQAPATNVKQTSFDLCAAVTACRCCLSAAGLPAAACAGLAAQASAEQQQASGGHSHNCLTEGRDEREVASTMQTGGCGCWVSWLGLVLTCLLAGRADSSPSCILCTVLLYVVLVA
jgi:hypothetical protein